MQRFATAPTRNGERVSDRAFRVLGAMRNMGPGAHSLNAIVCRSELSRSTVQRIMQSALREGLITQMGHGRYALSLTGEARPVTVDVRSASPETRQEMLSLREKLGMTICLHAALLVDTPVQTCVEWCRGPQGAPVEASPGTVRPLTADAAGKVILAHLGNGCDPGDFRRVRTCGYSVTVGPTPDHLMVAAPLLQGDIPIGAISVIGRREECESRIAAFVAPLRNVCASVGARVSQPC
ncbi:MULTISPECIES: helix-turn-helix domain-containing protein [Streptomyces]|uniref:helix-turn-helix domain-containing protein n=1 Tax=Streptomyces TaxID=1883 RepID=UPI00037169F5|nr:MULTISPECIES: helix-turn-helix domain-containing protein [Streptomyces]MYW56762.1 helix-turn-helix domain-containing protein [Streptomyces sp. SID8370]MYW85061.1 helix-turn-helix domain-containing protein [Streptomyces sp. SID8371]